MTGTTHAKDLGVLAADKNIEFALKGLLSRSSALELRPFTRDVFVHPDRDPGCLLRAHGFLQTFAQRYEHAVVVFDREGCGQDTKARTVLESDVENRLTNSGWGGRSAAIVLDPEIEAWVWSDSPYVDTVLGWEGRTPSLRDWLRFSNLLGQTAIKPDRPKEAMDSALRKVRIPHSAALFEKLASGVGLDRCTDEAFGKLRATLAAWFSMGAGYTPAMPRSLLLASLLAALAACTDDARPPADGGAMDLPVIADALAPSDAVASATTWCGLPTTAASHVAGAMLPAGFCIRRYARVREARVLQFSPSGDLFVSSPQQQTPGFTGPGDGAIYVLPDDNHDGVADANLTYLNLHTRRELESVHGLMFLNGLLYYTYANGVNSIPYANGDRAPHTPAAAINSVILPVAELTDAQRWTHDLATDGTNIFVTMGVYGADACPLANPRQGAILAIGPGHSMQGDIWAQGFRDPLFIRCQSWGSCYVSELTDDGWGPSPPLSHEKIATFHSGDSFGYPCCYDTNAQSSFSRTTPFNCAAVATSMIEMPVGYTPMGQDFEPGLWPAPYTHAMLIGLHGAVGSWFNTGIQWVPMDATSHQPTGPASVFLGGWGAPPAANVGRVADALFAPDGRLFFTDDQAGAVFWIAPMTLEMPSH